MPFTATVLTMFPEAFPGPLGVSLIGTAWRERGLWSLDTVDIRAFSTDTRGFLDDTPAGGGPGAVLKADVVARALDSVEGSGRPLLYMSARGRPLTQARVKEWAKADGITVLCGRFEGVDQRVLDARGFEEVSVGDAVLAGGEAAAMVVIEACVRLIPGVLGQAESLSSESFEDGLLEHPQYTRPRTFEGLEIPEVLLSGDHKKVAQWREEQRRETTRERRPDLWAAYPDKTNARPGPAKSQLKSAKLEENRMNILQTIEAEEKARLIDKRAIPDFQPGDTLRVMVKIKEGERERIQAFEGVCIARAGGGVNENFTVRKISFGEGVERVFPILSPNIDAIEVKRRGVVRRAKLYYLRDRRGKSARIAEKQTIRPVKGVVVPETGAAQKADETEA